MMGSSESGTWLKSSRSANTDTCVEVKVSDRDVGVRDTKNRRAGHLTVDRQAWRAFLDNATR